MRFWNKFRMTHFNSFKIKKPHQLDAAFFYTLIDFELFRSTFVNGVKDQFVRAARLCPKLWSERKQNGNTFAVFGFYHRRFFSDISVFTHGPTAHQQVFVCVSGNYLNLGLGSICNILFTAFPGLSLFVYPESPTSIKGNSNRILHAKSQWMRSIHTSFDQ